MGDQDGPTMQSRRHFMKFAGAACSGSLLCPCHSFAQPQENAAPRRIDVHHHVTPPIWMREAREQIAATNRNLPPIADWSVQRSLDEMDRNGVRSAVASVTNPGIWFGDPAAARKLSRGCRISGASCCGSSAALRRVCNAAVAGRRGEPRRDCLQLRYPEGGWHRPDDKLRRQMAG